MRGYLLDTNIALIAVTEPGILTAAALKAIMTGPNVLSVASYWEVMLKAMKGKLHVDPRAWWEQSLLDLKATPLAIQPRHVSEVYNLPPIHHDPFDRLLIAQATVEGLPFVTTDQTVSAYRWDRFHVIA